MLLCAIAFAAGCSSSSTTPVSLNVTPTAVPLAAESPFTVTAVQSLVAPTAGPGGTAPPIPIALPSNAVASGQISLPDPAAGLPAGALAQTELTDVVPSGSGLPALSLLRRATASLRTTQAVSLTPVLYLNLELSFTATFSEPPSFVFTLDPSLIVSGAAYYLAFYDSLRPSLGWQDGFEGPAVIASPTLTFTGTSGPLTLDAFVPYWFALYAVPADAPAPTPAPVASVTPLPPPIAPTPFPTATPAPTPTPTATPANSAPIQISNTRRTTSTEATR